MALTSWTTPSFLLESYLWRSEVCWCVSPYVSANISLHIALIPCSRCCCEFVTSVYALYANSFVRERSVGLFRGGLVDRDCVSGIPRNSWWAVYPNCPRWSIVIKDEGVSAFGECSNCADQCCRRCCFALVILLHGPDVWSVCKKCEGIKVDQTLVESWFTVWTSTTTSRLSGYQYR